MRKTIFIVFFLSTIYSCSDNINTRNNIKYITDFSIVLPSDYTMQFSTDSADGYINHNNKLIAQFSTGYRNENFNNLLKGKPISIDTNKSIVSKILLFSDSKNSSLAIYALDTAKVSTVLGRRYSGITIFSVDASEEERDSLFKIYQSLSGRKR